MVIFIKRKVLFIFLFILCLLLISVRAEYIVKEQPQYSILIKIDKKTLYLLENDVCIKKYPIASGTPDLPSPIGVWEIIEKDEWGKGFGGRWLGLNVSWGKYGIHGTTNESSIGKAASHGCIRMYRRDIKELFNFVTIGTKVVIKNGPLGPFGMGFRDLIPGDRGADVLAVQKRLKKLGFYDGNLDGIYGEELKNALYAFQEKNQLKIKFTITKPDYTTMGFMELE